MHYSYSNLPPPPTFGSNVSHFTRYYITLHFTGYDYVNDILRTGPPLQNSAGINHRIYPEKTGHLCLTAIKLIYIPHNSNSRIKPRQMAHLNCNLCGTKGLWFSYTRVMVVSRNFSIQAYDLKCSKVPTAKKCPTPLLANMHSNFNPRDLFRQVIPHHYTVITGKALNLEAGKRCLLD